MTKTFEMKDGVFHCIFDNGSCAGSLVYSFESGDLDGHKPDNMSNEEWLICCRKFVAICLKMNAPFLDI